jgi:hypothetical protein
MNDVKHHLTRYYATGDLAEWEVARDVWLDIAPTDTLGWVQLQIERAHAVADHLGAIVAVVWKVYECFNRRKAGEPLRKGTPVGLYEGRYFGADHWKNLRPIGRVMKAVGTGDRVGLHYF